MRVEGMYAGENRKGLTLIVIRKLWTRWHSCVDCLSFLPIAWGIIADLLFDKEGTGMQKTEFPLTCLNNHRKSNSRRLAQITWYSGPPIKHAGIL